MSSTVAGRPAVPNFGIDADRLLAPDSFLDALRRRLDGRYAVDEFGGDPHLQDLLLNPVVDRIRVDVRHGARIPRLGPALLIANRGCSAAEPLVLTAAVHRLTRRRVRLVGAPSIPLAGALTQKLGCVGPRVADVAAVLRAGHLVAAPFAQSWLGIAPGDARALIAATMGFRLYPVAVRAGGPAGLPLRPWIVSVGAPLATPDGTAPGDPLAAAELSESVRLAIAELLER